MTVARPLFGEGLHNSMLDNSIAKPFFQYVGGKRHLADWICDHFPSYCIPHYYEPFIGGGAIFWHVRKQNRARNYTISDLSPQVICNYISLRDHYTEFADLYREVVEKHNYDYFYEAKERKRELYRKDEFTVETAVLDIYLKSTSVHSSQYTPSDWGNQSFRFNKDLLLVCHRLLQNVNILLCDYRTIKPNVLDVVYCDPPYVNSYQGEYRKKSGYHWDDKANKQLANQAIEWKSCGARIYVSTYTRGEETIEQNSLNTYLEGFHVDYKRGRFRIGFRPLKQRPAITELLFISQKGKSNEQLASDTGMWKSGYRSKDDLYTDR